jgi:cytidylate kinase
MEDAALEFTDGNTPREQALIQSIVNAELIFQRHKPGAKGHPPVVALSRDHGAGGEEIAQRLAQRLGVELYDRQILERVAEESHVGTQQMSQMDDKAGIDSVTSWVRGLFSSSTAYPESYRYHLVNVVLGICRSGGIILGRGAHLILATKPAFRVRIVGSPENCAERVAANTGITMDEARKQVQKINTERDDYLFNMFKRHLHDATLFDLVINTDKFPDMDAAVELILIAMAQSGHTVPSQPGEAQ